MSATPITGSSNISLLDSRIVANLCVGTFSIDVSPSNFTGSGAANVSGIKVKVTNPFGSIIKDYGSGYDVIPSQSGGIVVPVVVNIPTKAGQYQYGVYTFGLQLTDQNGTSVYEVIKTQNICPYPDEKKVCQDSVEMLADCQSGKLNISMAEAPTYQSKLPQSKTQNWTLYYPTASGMASEVATVGNFSVPLFEGVYKLTGSVCVTYAMGDNIFISLGSTGNWGKNVKCVIDYTCIEPKLDRLGKELAKACTDKDRAEINDTIFSVLWLLTKIQIRLGAGNDASDDIDLLETILGCSCTCECNGSSPIINSNPTSNVVVEGCNVTPQVIGLTTHYTINAYNYVVSVDPSQSIVSISAPGLNGCTKTQTISLNIPLLYTTIKNQIISNLEYSFWGGIMSNSLAGVNASCLGLNSTQWNALSLTGKIQAVIDEVCSDSSSCSATVTGSVAKNGEDAVFTFAMVNGYYLEIYVDGVLRGTVLAGATTFTVQGVADGQSHDYSLIPRCVKGDIGSPLIGTFQYIACPDILPLSVSSNNVNDVACPYSLTALIVSLPAGITAAWHTANNTSAATLVSNPAAVNSGVYYGFAKNASGCHSMSVQVQVICATDSACSAPQNLTVSRISGANLIQFDSAAFPPPSNSYTVKRRRSTDPDISGSYTTIGTPSFNSTSGKWEISDSGSLPFYMYSYLVQSNCGGTTPSVQTQGAFGASEAITVTPFANSIHLSVGGSSLPTHQVRFDLLNNTGAVTLDTVTLNTGVSLVSGDFFYLNPSTSYRVRIRRYISGFLVDEVGTSIYNTLTGDNMFVYPPVSGQVITAIDFAGNSPVVSLGTFPLNPGDAGLAGRLPSFTGVISVTITGTPAANSYLHLTVDGVEQQVINTTAPGVHNFTSFTYLASQFIAIVPAVS